MAEFHRTNAALLQKDDFSLNVRGENGMREKDTACYND